MTDLSEARWQKATMSTGSNGGCVEVALNLAPVVAIRDSKRPEAGAHVVDESDFRAFLEDAKAGRYNI